MADLSGIILAESPGVYEVLRQTLLLLTQHGARLHDKLVIVEAAGELHIECRGAEPGETLITYPVSCLVPLNLFELEHANNRIQIARVLPEATDLQHNLFELTLRLYELTDKVKNFVQRSPEASLGLDHPLTRAIQRTDGSVSESGHRPIFDYGTVAEDEWRMKKFWAARVLDSDRLNTGSSLMPIIELINHHSETDGFEINDGSLGVNVDLRTTPGRNESFVNYGKYKDAFSLFRYYHFFHDVPQHLNSIPLKLTPSCGGHLFISRTYSSHTAEEILLRKRLPPLTRIENGNVYCDSLRLSLDPDRDQFLHGVDFITKMLGRQRDFPVTDLLIRDLQSQLIQANFDHYHQLISLAETEPATDQNELLLSDINSVANHQLALLSRYRKKHDL